MKKKITIKYVNSLTPSEKYFDVWDTELPGFFLRVQPTGNISYYLFYRNDDNEKRTYSIGKGLTPVQARDIAEKAYGRVKNGADIVVEAKTRKTKAAKARKTTLNTFLNDVYQQWLLENRQSGRNAYNRIKHSFEMIGTKQLEAITKWDLERWKKARRADGASDQTLKKDLAELKSMVRRAKEWDFIKTNPIYDYKYGRTNNELKVRYLTLGERSRLYESLDARQLRKIVDRDNGNEWRKERGYTLLHDYNKNTYTDYLKPIVVLALNTGMRRGELFKLTWSNVDFSSNRITVSSSTAKSKRTRYIPLNTEARETLLAWRNQQADAEGLVFHGKDGGQLNDIRKGWLTVMSLASIKDFRFHDLRHDFASQLVMKGVDLYVVKELLGHSTIQMTERYAHLAPKQLEDAVNLLNV